MENSNISRKKLGRSTALAKNSSKCIPATNYLSFQNKLPSSTPYSTKQLELRNDDIVDVANLIKNSNKIIILSGAGISVGAGIPDFRSKNGLYEMIKKRNFKNMIDPQQIFELNYFLTNPHPFYQMLKNIYPNDSNKPTDTHKFIKLIELNGKLLRNYSQNIDTIERKININRLVLCHGSLLKSSCTSSTCNYSCDTSELEIESIDNVPKCPRCRNIIKPDVVFFGEELSSTYHTNLEYDLKECDLFIVIGTSLEVNPVKLLPTLIGPTIKKILINKTQIIDKSITFDYKLFGDCELIIRKLCKRLGDSFNLDLVYTPASLQSPSSVGSLSTVTGAIVDKFFKYPQSPIARSMKSPDHLEPADIKRSVFDGFWDSLSLFNLTNKTNNINLSSNQEESDQEEAGQLNASQLNAGLLNANQLKTGLLNANQLKTGLLNANQLKTGLLNVGQLNAGQLNAGQLNAGQLNAGLLNANQLKTGLLNANQLKTGLLNANQLKTGLLNAGQLNAGQLNAGASISHYPNLSNEDVEDDDEAANNDYDEEEAANNDYDEEEDEEASIRRRVVQSKIKKAWPNNLPRNNEIAEEIVIYFLNNYVVEVKETESKQVHSQNNIVKEDLSDKLIEKFKLDGIKFFNRANIGKLVKLAIGLMENNELVRLDAKITVIVNKETGEKKEKRCYVNIRERI